MFSERLVSLRKSQGMKQEELCKMLGISRKTLSSYEHGRYYPRNFDLINQMCEIFNVSQEYMMSNEDRLLQQATAIYGTKGRQKAERLISETSALFAGGELDNEDKELIFKAISELFWESREANK